MFNLATKQYLRYKRHGPFLKARFCIFLLLSSHKLLHLFLLAKTVPWCFNEITCFVCAVGGFAIPRSIGIVYSSYTMSQANE